MAIFNSYVKLPEGSSNIVSTLSLPVTPLPPTVRTSAWQKNLIQTYSNNIWLWKSCTPIFYGVVVIFLHENSHIFRGVPSVWTKPNCHFLQKIPALKNIHTRYRNNIIYLHKMVRDVWSHFWDTLGFLNSPGGHEISHEIPSNSINLLMVQPPVKATNPLENLQFSWIKWLPVFMCIPSGLL